MATRGLVLAVLRPHHRKNAQLGESRRAPQPSLDRAVLVVGEPVRASLLEIDRRLARQRNRSLDSARRGHIELLVELLEDAAVEAVADVRSTLMTIERKILSPSSPPSAA